MKTQQIKGELNHALHPRDTIYRWIVFYILLALILFMVLDMVASQYRTYRLPTGSVELSVPYITYLVGEPITFTVKNNYESAIYLPNNCPEEPLIVYKQNGAAWERIHAKTDPATCAQKERQIRIEPHDVQQGSYAAWPSLFEKPGKYRIVARVDYFGSAPYQDFEVIAKPEKQKVYVQAPRTTSQSPRSTSGSGGSQTQTLSPSQPSAQSPQQVLKPYSVTTSRGTISVEYSSTYITVKSIIPAAGCTYEGGRSGTFIETTFKCSGGETQVQLWLSNGQIQQKIE